MTDLPYTYTEPNGDSLRMFSDGPDLVVTVRQDGGARTVVVPREETPNLARAVLAAAGDTDEEPPADGILPSVRELRRMHEEEKASTPEAPTRYRDRDGDLWARAVTGRYRLIEWSDGRSAPWLTRTLDTLRGGYGPLTPATATDTTEDQDAQLPDRGGDVIDDIAIALARRDDLSDEHRAFYLEVLDRFEALTSDRDRLRTAWESARRGRAQARTQLDGARRWGRILEAQRKDLRKKLSAETDRMAALRIAYQAAKDADLPEEDMVEPGDEVSDRVGALEQQFTDLAALVHGHGEDLARIRYRFTAEDDG